MIANVLFLAVILASAGFAEAPVFTSVYTEASECKVFDPCEGDSGNCSYSDGRGFFVNMECATRTTVERVQFLNDRLRECSSTGCQPSTL